jgi:chromosome segregation ATPase
MDGLDGQLSLQNTISNPPDLPIEQEARDTMSDPRSKLKGALTRFLSEASEQASLQLRKDSAKRVLDRRVADYEKSRNIHEDYPAAAEALGAAKKRAQQEFEELDEEFMRKHQGSLVLIEVITDCVFSESAATSAPVQSQVLKEVQQTAQLYRTSLRTIEKDLETTRTAVQTELASIRQEVTGWEIQMANLAADVEQLKSCNESVDFKNEIDALSSRVKSLPDFRIELGKETERINGALNAQAKDIEHLRMNRTSGPEFESLKSTINSLTKSEKENKNVLTKLQADLKDRDKALRTTTDTRLSDIGTRVSTLENARSETTTAMQKVETFDGRVKRLENGLPKDKVVTQKLETIDSRVKRLESRRLEDTAIKNKLEAVDTRIQRLESGQEKVNITRQSLANVESSVQRTTQWLEDINKRLKAMEDDHFNETPTTKKLEELENRLKAMGDGSFNNREKQEVVNMKIQNMENRLATSSEQGNGSVSTERLNKILEELRAEMKRTQEVGDELVGNYLQDLNDRVKALQDNNLEYRVNVLEKEKMGSDMAIVEQKFETRIEPLEKVYTAFSTKAIHEINRISSDIKRLNEDTKQIASTRASSVPPQVTHDIGRISADIQTLKEDFGKLTASTASIGPLTNRAQNTDERINILVNEIDGLKVGYTNLDFSMHNLSRPDLTRLIQDQLDAHRRNPESNITTISLRNQELDEHVKKNESEKHAELARIAEALRQDMGRYVNSCMGQRVENSLREFKEDVENTLTESSKRLNVIQHEVDKSNQSLDHLREDVDSRGTTFQSAIDLLTIAVFKSKSTLTTVQKEISGAKTEFSDALAALKDDLSGLGTQKMQEETQAESCVSEKKPDVNVTPMRKVNRHGQLKKSKANGCRTDRVTATETVREASTSTDSVTATATAIDAISTVSNALELAPKRGQKRKAATTVTGPRRRGRKTVRYCEEFA